MARDFLQHQPRALIDLILVFSVVATALIPWCAAIAIGLFIGGACS